MIGFFQTTGAAATPAPRVAVAAPVASTAKATTPKQAPAKPQPVAHPKTAAAAAKRPALVGAAAGAEDEDWQEF